MPVKNDIGTASNRSNRPRQRPCKSTRLLRHRPSQRTATASRNVVDNGRGLGGRPYSLTLCLDGRRCDNGRRGNGRRGNRKTGFHGGRDLIVINRRDNGGRRGNRGGPGSRHDVTRERHSYADTKNDSDKSVPVARLSLRRLSLSLSCHGASSLKVKAGAPLRRPVRCNRGRMISQGVLTYKDRYSRVRQNEKQNRPSLRNRMPPIRRIEKLKIGFISRDSKLSARVQLSRQLPDGIRYA